MRTLLLLCLLLTGCDRLGPEKKGSIPAKARREPVYPYPECKACMAWLRKNVGEPDSLEAIAWKRKSREGEGVFLALKYRGKNDRGGWSVECRNFVVQDGKVTSSILWESTAGWDD